MIKLKDEQHILLKEYQELLDIVEEAFEYIVESFTNLEKTESDRLLLDIFYALPQIASVNVQLSQLFKEHSSVGKVLAVFDDVAEKAELVVENFQNLERKQQIIRQELYPAFASWSVMIQQKFKPYTQS
jgi:hypothetical protein